MDPSIINQDNFLCKKCLDYNDLNANDKMNEPQLFDGTSHIDGSYYHDSDILRYIGLDNYIMLHRKFPLYFFYFKECNKEIEINVFSPGNINLYISDNPRQIKSEIIKTIHYKRYISENSKLVNLCDNIDLIPKNINDTTFIWIFICLIFISLIVISIYVMVNTKSVNKFFKNQ